jgi:hypothetical protein
MPKQREWCFFLFRYLRILCYQKCKNIGRKIVAFRINLKKKPNFVDKFQTNIIFLKDLTLIASEN